MNQKDILNDSFAKFTFAAISHPSVWFIIVLLFFNWGLEALKWKLIAQKFSPIKYTDALSGVLTGVSLGMITPHGIGDYAGRVLQLETNSKLAAIGAVFVSRIAQLMITIWMGSAALLYMIYTRILSDVYIVNFALLQVIIITNVIVLLIILFYKKIASWLQNKYTKPYLKILRLMSARDMTVIMILSFLRYGVFALQYLILLHYIHIHDSVLLLLGGVAFIFLIKSVVPTLFDIGIREAAAIYFFALYGIDSTDSIVFASLLLWLINIACPALIGAWLILKIRLDGIE